MNPPTLPFTEAELKKAGLLGEGESLSLFARLGMPCSPVSASVSEPAAQVLKTMTEHPDLLKLPLFALECINRKGQQRKGPGSPALSNLSVSSTPKATVVSEHGPDEYERLSYYNGIAGDGDHPELVYRSDLLTSPFPKPVGRHAHIPVKSLRGVFDTPLNSVWDTVGPQIRDLIKAREIHWSSVHPARFFTHGPPGEEAKGSLGPVVIWVGVIPGSTSPDTAHDVSQEILALLLKSGVEDVVVEWHEAVPQRLVSKINPNASSTRY